MKKVFELDPVDVIELVGSDDFHFGHQEGRVQVSVCDACVDLASRDANLVQNIAISGDKRMVRFAPQNIDRATCQIIVVVFICE